MIVLHQIDPIAISLGPLRVHWYGLMYLLGFLVAWWLGRRRIRAGRLPGIDEDGFGDLLFYGLIGVVLILDGLDVHVPKPYIYFAMAFSVLVEVFNLLMRQHAAKRHVPGAGEW